MKIYSAATFAFKEVEPYTAHVLTALAQQVGAYALDRLQAVKGVGFRQYIRDVVPETMIEVWAEAAALGQTKSESLQRIKDRLTPPIQP